MATLAMTNPVHTMVQGYCRPKLLFCHFLPNGTLHKEEEKIARANLLPDFPLHEAAQNLQHPI